MNPLHVAMIRISLFLLSMLLLSCEWGRNAGVERKTVKISVAAYELPITEKRYAELSSAIAKEFQRFGYIAMTKLVLADSISELAAHKVAEARAFQLGDHAGFQLTKFLKNCCVIFRRNAHSAILYRDHNAICITPRRHHNPPARVGKLYRVGE